MRMMATNKRKNILIAALCAFIIQFFCMNSHAATSASTATKTVSTAAPAAVTASASAMASGSGSTGGGSGTMTPDLFTGTLSDRIPIEVAPGRKGMAPSLALSYQSNAGNGWVGVGWDLEVGAIERSTKNGVNYSGDEYVLHIGGSTIDLVHIYTNEFGASVTDEYRAKIESGFSRVKKLSSSEGSYWEVTDKSGTRYLYGQTAGSRQDNPADANRVFKWCLDKVEDTNGSYMSLNYEKTPEGKPYEGEIYLKQIDYAGNSNAGRTPTNYVHFYLESRNDAPVMYTTNFAVKTAYRLKTIEVRANGYPVKVYKLTYASSSSTSRSLLSSVQQYGNDATVDTVTGNITNEAVASKLPATVFDWQLGGSSFTSTWDSSQLLTSGTYLDENNRLWFTDVNGDGKADLLIRDSGNDIDVKLSQPTSKVSDLLISISSGLGATTTIEYKPSTQYPMPQPQLPFPVQTVYSITTNDGNGNTATTTYDYQGGYYHIGEKDFRGFNHVTVTGPDDNGKRTISETWFHQGNDTVVDVNDPSGHDGYMKGKPYRTRVKDEQGKVYSETTTTYLSGASAPYFNPPIQMDGYSCGGVPVSCANDASAKHTQTVLTYTYIGNVTREDHYGDLSDANDDYTVIKSFSPNSTAWILGLPTSETNYQGTYPGVDAANLDPAKKVANATFYYDGVTDCNTASTNQTPTKGNLTRIVRWLDGVNDPSVRMAYDNYGNLSCTRDARGNVSTVSYDGSFTFPTAGTTPPVGTNLAGYKTTTQYYGVDGVAADKGLYGQVKSVTDPNGVVVSTMEYDTFGRKVHTTAPDGTWTAWSYNNFGTVGLQHVKVDASAGLSSWTYFDGLGRTIIGKKTGPDNKVIATQTQYNPNGTVAQTSLPYFENANETVRMTVFTYDSLGRVTSITNPDATTVQSCYNNLVTGFIDAEQHLKRETKNVQEKLIKVEEFTGTYASCAAAVGSPYAVTTYDYDVLGHLRFVTDAAGNKTEMHYDNLGRKDYMRDPDMGYWTYAYDANGNLSKQTDARGQIITFTYDSLNRITKKHYPRLTFGPDVVYTYDASPASYPTYTTYPIGRLTTMTDGSGTTTLFYDNMGRTTKTIKTIAGTNYPTGVAYTLGRLTSVTYPDGDVVNYNYDNGGNLIQATDPSTNKAYITYANFNALAQPGSVTYGNGVTTAYQYYPTNNRLMDITTLDSASKKLLGLTYYYSDGGNVKAIADNIDYTRSQTFTYDDINRLTLAQSMSYGTQSYSYDEIGNILSKEGVSYTYTDSNGVTTKPHAVKYTTDGKTYTYDANGNMISSSLQSINYDYDNMPRSVITNNATTIFVYDGGGARVKKTTSAGTTIYIGKFYECNGSACSKYILAGGTRIALKGGTDTLYYHQDHLGSSRIVTNKDGNKVEEVHYLPFGAAQSDTGTVSVNHKYTSQEFDAETGLYYYNARYYNPVLGRFINADTIVPDPTNPQSLNRYSYVINNPLVYTDPSGHAFWKRVKDIIKKPAVALGIQAFINPTIGTYLLTRSESGKSILAGEIITMGAVGTVLCGGCTAPLVATVADSWAFYNARRAGQNGLSAVIRAQLMSVAAYMVASVNYSPELFGATKTNAWAAVANRMFDSALTGAVFGAATAEIHGGDVMQGAKMGAVYWSAGEAANMAIGHLIGFVGSGFKGPQPFKDGAFIYGGGNKWADATTFGNVIWTNGSTLSPNVMAHELGHAYYQGRIFGPAYLPLHIVDNLTFTHALEYNKTLLGGAPTYPELGVSVPTWWQ